MLKMKDKIINSIPFLKSRHYKKLRDSDKDSFNIVLRDLIEFSGAERPSYVKGDHCQTAYNEGMKRVINRISNFLKYDEEAIKESKEIYKISILDHNINNN